MNNLFAIYQDDILTIFKNHYKRLINKSIHIHFEDVLNSTYFELQMPKAQDEKEISFLRDWYEQIHELTFLKSVFKSQFQEIIIHSEKHAQIIKAHEKENIALASLSKEDFELAILVFSLKHHQNWNFKNPFCSFNVTLYDSNLRATLIHSSCSPNSTSKIFFRSINTNSPSLELFNLNHQLSEILPKLILEKANILISGATASGKTTFLRAMIKEIPQEEHIVVLEDTYEIINEKIHQTSLLSDSECVNKTLKDYCSYALRMTPDRFVIGEMRSLEVVPFILAMNTGHKGLMSTIHANSSADALTRVALLFSLYSENQDISFSLITKLITKSIDYVIHLKNKEVVEIIQVLGAQDETPFFDLIYKKD